MLGILQDVQFACRTLRRSPGFALTAILTLGCGIGLTAGIFSVVWQTLLGPLPYAQPDRLVALDFNFASEKPSDSQVGTAADFLVRWSRSFSDFGVADGGTTGVNLSAAAAGPGHAYPVQQLRISRSFLPTLGVQPQLGRLFTAEEDTHHGPRAALLSDRLWRTKFGADPAILGRVIRIDEEDVPVVGVLPAGAVADLEGGTQRTEAAGLFQPLQLSAKDPGYEGNNYQMIARLRDGVSLPQAQQELRALLPRFAQQNAWYAGWKAPDGELNQLRAFPLKAALAGQQRSGLLALLGSAGAVLLVASLNVAGLMIARGSARTRELAVRSALGASRRGLVRLLFAEVMVLACAGAALGMFLAQAVSRAFLAYAPIDLPHWTGATPTWVIATATTALTCMAVALSGLLPLSLILGRQINQSLHHVGSQGQSAAYQRTGRILIVGQVTLAFVLLMAASLLLQVFLHLRSVAPGVETDRTTIGQVTLKGDAYAQTARNVTFEERVVQALRHTPGVEAAGAVNGLPLDRGLNISGWPVGRKDLQHVIEGRLVGAGYMEAIGIPLLQGRTIRESDTTDSPKVAIVSQSAAKRWWPQGNAIGSRLNFGNEAEYEIVGIARDTHEQSLLGTPGILVYIPTAQLSDKFTKIINNWFPTTFVVRAHRGVDVATALHNAVTGADAELPLARVTTMQNVVDQSFATPRFFGWLSSSFAALTLLLAAIGLFGLMSFQVTQRTREIGVRMALGATRAQVLRSFLQGGLLLAATGVLLGIGLSAGLPHLLASASQEFATLAGQRDMLVHEVGAAMFACVVLCGAAAVASSLPAARAANVEPVQALRSE